MLQAGELPLPLKFGTACSLWLAASNCSENNRAIIKKNMLFIELRTHRRNIKRHPQLSRLPARSNTILYSILLSVLRQYRCTCNHTARKHEYQHNCQPQVRFFKYESEFYGTAEIRIHSEWVSDYLILLSMKLTST